MENEREVVRIVLNGEKPPYVPWHFQFTEEAMNKLVGYCGSEDKVDSLIGNHILELGSPIGFFDDLGDDWFQDVFGVVWNRSIDKDIGIVEGRVLPEPSLKDFQFPDPMDKRLFEEIPKKISKHPNRFRVFYIGFSLFERAWTLRGMENLMMDLILHPEFVHELFASIADYNIAQARKAMRYDIDAVYFGDDWGQQRGLIMGYPYWKDFIYPQLKRMYSCVRNEGKFVMIHSCGDVDELFDDLIEIGLNCFNPFQPEVMDTSFLLKEYKTRLSFHGGLSTQKTLPFGTIEQVQNESACLLQLGMGGNYIFAPSHAVEGDVPLENILAFIEKAKNQDGYLAVKRAGRIPTVNYSNTVNKIKTQATKDTLFPF